MVVSRDWGEGSSSSSSKRGTIRKKGGNESSNTTSALYKYLAVYRSVLTDLKELDSRHTFDSSRDEQQKSKEIYRTILHKMHIDCVCGHTITGSQISKLFNDLANDFEKEMIDVKGKKPMYRYYNSTY